jgi:hypothetical protein
MIKCFDKGRWTCIGRNGLPKKSFTNDESAISAAKLINNKEPDSPTKLVAYKCSHCQNYHLLTVKRRIRK